MTPKTSWLVTLVGGLVVCGVFGLIYERQRQRAQIRTSDAVYVGPSPQTEEVVARLKVCQDDPNAHWVKDVVGDTLWDCDGDGTVDIHGGDGLTYVHATESVCKVVIKEMGIDCITTNPHDEAEASLKKKYPPK